MRNDFDDDSGFGYPAGARPTIADDARALAWMLAESFRDIAALTFGLAVLVVICLEMGWTP